MVALAILAALAGLAGCDQDKVLYSGRNYLMFSDTLYHYAVQESNEKFEVPVSAMKKRFLYIALIALTLGACTEQDIVEQPSIPTDGGTEVRLPADVNSGELLIKFKPEMTDILDRTMTRAAGNVP